MFGIKNRPLSEQEFFERTGYRKYTADFVAFIIAEVAPGFHDLIFVAEDMQETYSFQKFPSGAIGGTNNTVDALCVAIEKVHSTNYASKETTHRYEGLLTIRSYPKQVDGTPDFQNPVLRAYQFKKFSIAFITAATLKGLYSPLMENDINQYAEPWQYTPSPKGKMRVIAYETADCETSQR